VPSQAGRGLVVIKTLPGTGIMTLRMEADTRLKTIHLHHPLHLVAIILALEEAKESVVAEEVVAEVEVWLQFTAATANNQDGVPYYQVTRDTGSTLT